METDVDVQRSLAHWVLESPVTRGAAALRQKPIWLVLAEKVLRRGTTPLLSPSLEAALRTALGIQGGAKEPEWHEALLFGACEARPVPALRKTDSEDEGHAYDRFEDIGLGMLLGYCLPQVSIESLTPSQAMQSRDTRVDFVVAHPLGLRLVIEIDGGQHAQDKVRLADEERDHALIQAGYTVLRIPVAEVRAGTGSGLLKLTEKAAPFLSTMRSRGLRGPAEGLHQLLHASRRASQIQLAIVHLLSTGALPSDADRITLACEFGEHNEAILTESGAAAIAQAAVTDLSDLLADLHTLYAREGKPPRIDIVATADDPDITLSWADEAAARSPTVHIRDSYLPVDVSTALSKASPCTVSCVDYATCERLLRRVFGKERFREGQYECVERALLGQDAIVLLPTGAGKSIAFQLAALIRPGVTIVIDPIISLIDDQLFNLQLAGIDRTVQISSQIDRSRVEDYLKAIGSGEYLFVYIAPERFQSTPFRESLRALTTFMPISCIVIDEAHCVSEWGHDFRPAYLNLARIARDYCTSEGVTPPLLALTGTASRSVLKDIRRELGIDDFQAIITPTSFDRPNLHFAIETCRSPEKEARLTGLLETLPRQFGEVNAAFFDPRGARTRAGLVFCPHVNGKFGVQQIAEYVTGHIGRRTPFYSGTAPKRGPKYGWDEEKRRIALDFKRDRFPVLVCTKAFGMGIDKPNIRFTIHYCLPASIESFYQEAGRAGRDGADSLCCVVASVDDERRAERVLSPQTSIEAVHEVMEGVTQHAADDITRSLFFHTRSFAGLNDELDVIRELVAALHPLESQHDAVVRWNKDDEDKLRIEKGIHRLVVLGVVADYTIDYSKKQFELRVSGCDQEEIVQRLFRYIENYQHDVAATTVERLRRAGPKTLPNFVTEASRALVKFVYDVIERGRRRALAEMWGIARHARTDEAIRARVLNYLSRSEFSEQLDQMIEAPAGGLALLSGILAKVGSPLEAAELRGEAGRQLEAYPDHPGLLFVRAASETMCRDADSSIIRENIAAATSSAIERYGVDRASVLNTAASVTVIADRRTHAAGVAAASGVFDALNPSMTEAGLGQVGDDARNFARSLLRADLSADTTLVAATVLVRLGCLDARKICEVLNDE